MRPGHVLHLDELGVARPGTWWGQHEVGAALIAVADAGLTYRHVGAPVAVPVRQSHSIVDDGLAPVVEPEALPGCLGSQRPMADGCCLEQVQLPLGRCCSLVLTEHAPCGQILGPVTVQVPDEQAGNRETLVNIRHDRPVVHRHQVLHLPAEPRLQGLPVTVVVQRVTPLRRPRVDVRVPVVAVLTLRLGSLPVAVRVPVVVARTVAVHAVVPGVLGAGPGRGVRVVAVVVHADPVEILVVVVAVAVLVDAVVPDLARAGVYVAAGVVAVIAGAVAVAVEVGVGVLDRGGQARGAVCDRARVRADPVAVAGRQQEQDHRWCSSQSS